MKKAFTMIELIFVIVILGILAAVAIPKLNATRDDAELSKSIMNFTTLMSDLTSYYVAKNGFVGIKVATNQGIAKATNVPLGKHNSNELTNYPAGYITYKNKNCLYVEAMENRNYIYIRGNGISECETLIDKINEKNIITEIYSDTTFATKSQFTNNVSDKRYIKMLANNVNWD
ncbi:prepilin-type N-terminal cleavage/methylation domain-containing protein [Campylobacter sp. RM12651]|uniref:type II secretion system protein n=1 Tax=Campylobacter sp. RM12651 TaxID=1660079 RepID=UPI001EFA4A8F|nr:prepilin-type N-terminal cleavage/methylation domain-containing protein [Campylobacter sp. RM12651]ULO04290.1 N-terminal methylation domain protein [Campylobacter sp. RM12651]